MKLNDIFTRSVVTAAPEETLAGVALKLQEHNVGTIVIVEDRRPVGIVTDRDLALALGARRISPDTEVQNVMTRHVLAIPEDTSIYTATKFMSEREVRRLPIVDREDRLVGIVTLDDLLHFWGENCTTSLKGSSTKWKLNKQKGIDAMATTTKRIERQIEIPAGGRRPGTLEEVARLAKQWFVRHLTPDYSPSR